MKKIKVLIFTILLSIFSSTLAVDVTQISIWSPENNCNWWTWNVRYYEWETRYFRDLLSWWDTNYAWAIWFNTSNIKVYNPYSSLNIKWPFVFKSNIRPEKVNQIVVCSNDAWTQINRWLLPNRNTLAAQLVYSISRRYNNWYINWVPASYNYTLPDRQYLTKNYTNKPNFNWSITQDNECFNIYVSYCWDWHLDSDHWEICDDGNNIDWDGCDSTCKPESVKNPQVKVDKKDANPADLDKVIWNDSQMVKIWDEAVFKIRVTNNWQENLKNIRLSDMMAPNCAWNVTLPSTYPSTWSNFTFGWAWNHSDNLLQVWEWFEYTCNKSNTTANYTNEVRVDATWETSNKDVNSKDTTPVLTIKPNIQIDKRDANTADLDKVIWNDTQTVLAWSWAVFKIKVTNNSNEAINDIVLIDPIAPNCAWNVTLPSTYPSTWSNFTFGWTWNHSDWVLDPGESFEYTCDRANTQNWYTNTVSVNWKWVTSQTPVTATDTTPVLIIKPAIQIDKRDANADDLDWNIWNDTQTVKIWSWAVFKIRVTNTSEESLKNINLTDPIAPNCGWNVILPWVYPSTFLSFVTWWTWDHTNTTLDPGEWFEYTCDRANTQAWYTNQVSVNAIWITTNTTVTATDTSPVLVKELINPSINVDKRDANQDDLDWIIWNDTQTVRIWSWAVFKIRVTNNWQENLKDIVLIDALAPNCAWNITLPSSYPSTWSNFTMWWSWTYSDNELEVWEWFEFTCSKGDTQVWYTNEVVVNAIWINTNKPVTAKDTTPVVVSWQIKPTIQIDKRDANSADLDWNIWNDTQTVNPWAGAVFKIRVTNNWQEDLKNLSITDILAPNCWWNLTMPNTYPSTWSNFVIWWAWDHLNSNLEVWEWFEYTCDRANTQNSYTNEAIVNWVWINSNNNVTAKDTTPVYLNTWWWEIPNISVDKRDANPDDLDWNIWNDTQTVNPWSKAVFKIKYTNTYRDGIKDIRIEDEMAPECAGSLNLPNSYPSTWKNFRIWWEWNHSNDVLEIWEWFEYECEKPNTSSSYTNKVVAYWRSITNWVNLKDEDTSNVVVKWWWGWGWWSSNPNCVRISIPSLEISWNWKSLSEPWNVEITCYWDSNTTLIWIDCDYEWGSPSIDFQKSAVNDKWTKYANFVCNYTGNDRNYNPKCYVWWSIPSYTSLACWTHIRIWRTYCWDWVVQRPNSDWQMEECEKQNWVFPNWCTADCKTKDFTYPWEWAYTVTRWILTYPAWWNVYIRPTWQVVIWAWVNPYNIIWSSPYIWNDSSEDVYLDKYLCVYNSEKSAILDKNWNELDFLCSTNKIGWLYPWSKKSYETLNNWNKLEIKWEQISWVDYKDTILTASISWLRNAFFASDLKVRVSKAAIATVWGWTSYIWKAEVTADIWKVASDWYSDPDKNKNFVWGWVSTWSISSYTTKVTNTWSVEKIYTWQTTKTQVKIDKITTVNTTWTKNINENLENYNGISNVFIVKNWNLNINSDIVWNWVKTYIVENWNLLINKDITYPENIAFVVKWWNIIIKESVKNIKWTFIAIEKNSIWWKIISEKTQNKLVINWSLYWNIEELVNNRTYISNKNNTLNVWTIVSYGSSLFREQAPLVWSFIDEYLESKKIAR